MSWRAVALCALAAALIPAAARADQIAVVNNAGDVYVTNGDGTSPRLLAKGSTYSADFISTSESNDGTVFAMDFYSGAGKRYIWRFDQQGNVLGKISTPNPTGTSA
jgi:hypothetical protein